MQWIKRLLGVRSPIERKKTKLAKLQEKAFKAQRNGDLRSAGRYLHEAELLETKILELIIDENESR